MVKLSSFKVCYSPDFGAKITGFEVSQHAHIMKNRTKVNYPFLKFLSRVPRAYHVKYLTCWLFFKSEANFH